MNIKSYLDSTYLKLPEQAGLTEEANLEVVKKCIQEAIDESFKLIMIRPNCVKIAREMIDHAGSKVTVGTVIGFPEGTATLDEKLDEAKPRLNSLNVTRKNRGSLRLRILHSRTSRELLSLTWLRLNLH